MILNNKSNHHHHHPFHSMPLLTVISFMWMSMVLFFCHPIHGLLFPSLTVQSCVHKDPSNCTSLLLVQAFVDNEGSDWSLSYTIEADEQPLTDQVGRSWAAEQPIHLYLRRSNTRVAYTLTHVTTHSNAWEKVWTALYMHACVCIDDWCVVCFLLYTRNIMCICMSNVYT